MKKKFKTAMNRLLFTIAFFISLGINLKILYDAFGAEGDSEVIKVINDQFISDNPHSWLIFAFSVIFSCSNLLFWIIGVDHIGRHLWEDWGKKKGPWGP
jgi:hypothetical protein